MANKVYKWKNLSGTFRMNRTTLIKPNQVFEATEEQVPSAFRDVIIKVDDSIPVSSNLPINRSRRRKPAAGKTPAPLKDAKQTEFKIVDNKDGTYAIQNVEQNKIVNEKPLTEDEAKQLLDSLNEDE